MLFIWAYPQRPDAGACGQAIHSNLFLRKTDKKRISVAILYAIQTLFLQLILVINTDKQTNYARLHLINFPCLTRVKLFTA